MDGRMTKGFQSAAMYVLVFIIALLLIAIVVVVLKTLGVFELEVLSVLSELSEETGLSKESEVLTFLGIGMTGVVLMLQALIANKRAKAMEETARAQAEAARAQATANRNTETGQRQERLKNAIEHLGNESESVRLGGAYELFHLAEDTESLRHTILNILCSHIRRTTKEDTYQEKHRWQPSEEMQSLLTLLFVHGHGVCTNLHINLYESWLNGADLREARLSGADLRRASLNKALLGGARLERARFSEAHLKEARLEKACLREAYLFMVHMQSAYLEETQLQGADIREGHLTAAYLGGAHLQGADLSDAKMYGAILAPAMMQGALLSWTYLQGASLRNVNLQGAGIHDWDSSTPFADRIRSSTGRETDLSRVVDGGMARKRVEQIVNELLSPDRHHALEQRLEPYIGRPHRLGLPEDHSAVIGTYTAEDAEEWIAEHEVAMTTRNGVGSSPSVG